MRGAAASAALTISDGRSARSIIVISSAGSYEVNGNPPAIVPIHTAPELPRGAIITTLVREVAECAISPSMSCAGVRRGAARTDERSYLAQRQRPDRTKPAGNSTDTGERETSGFQKLFAIGVDGKVDRSRSTCLR